MKSHKHNRKLNIIMSSLTLITLTTATFAHAAPPWEQTGTLKASDNGGNFGNSISRDGKYMVTSKNTFIR